MVSQEDGVRPAKLWIFLIVFVPMGLVEFAVWINERILRTG